jgi:ubiquinone/menaquinone biosynthesis C-methylase UbiE
MGAVKVGSINYNEISRIYDKVRLGDILVVQRILENYPIDMNTKILDVGCGTGNNTTLLYNITGAQVHGIDQSEGMIEKAKKKCEEIVYIMGNAVNLEEIGDEEYDVVFMTDVIHHIKDIETMFKNIYRILRKNGAVFVFTDSHDHIKNNRLASRYFPETIEPELARYHSNESMLESMNKNSFIDIMAEDIVYPIQEDGGEKLLKIAENKGYSMFYLIPDEAWKKGMKKLREDLNSGTVSYSPKTLMLIGRK